MAKIEVNTIDNISGSSTLKIGDTNATTLDFDTGITSVTNIPTDLKNTPAFHAYRSSGQSLSSATFTKIEFNLEIFDSNNNYDNSTNYRFTPTTAGKYYCYSIIDSSWTGSVGGYRNQTRFYKNGTGIASTNKDAFFNDFYNSANLDMITGLYLGGIIDFNGSSDYLEIFHYSNASTPNVSGAFGAYKIIGA